MPVLRDFRKTVELTLPITKGKVWIYDCMLAQDSLDIDKIYVSDTKIPVEQGGARKVSLRVIKYYEALDATIKAMVSKWDFTDKDGKPTEPTVENIKRLPQKDFDYLSAEIDKRLSKQTLTATQKKN